MSQGESISPSGMDYSQSPQRSPQRSTTRREPAEGAAGTSPSRSQQTNLHVGSPSRSQQTDAHVGSPSRSQQNALQVTAQSPVRRPLSQSQVHARLVSLREQMAHLQAYPFEPIDLTTHVPRFIDENPTRKYSRQPRLSDELCDILVEEASRYEQAGEIISWEGIRAKHPSLNQWSGMQLKDKYRNLTKAAVGCRRQPAGTKARPVPQ